MDELVLGEFKSQSNEYMTGVVEQFGEQGCDAVLLGCTELPLVIDATSSRLPLLDSTRLLATAALRRAVHEE